MKKIPALFIGLFIITLYSFGQSEQGNIIYIVDSIPVIDDPEQDDEIVETDIADVNVIKNKDTLRSLGYDKFDGAIYIFTKEYRNRSEALKQIPSTRQMKRENGVWYYHGNPFSGQFIDYYYSGRKQGEGTFKEGKVDGLRKTYYQNGNVSTERYYNMSIENGMNKEYYEDGSLKQKGEFTHGREHGIWESYYPNGQVKLRSTYQNGDVVDSAFKYYSNGKIKERVFIKNGNVIADPALSKITQLLTKSNESNKQGDTRTAIKYCSKVIELDSTYASAYFSRGTIKLNDFQFDEAIADYDHALRLEPYMEVALTNRAFARIRKYQFAGSRTLSKSNEVTILASKDKVPIPKEEQEKICNDLQKAIYLGDKSEMINEAVSNYCQTNSSR